MGEIAEMILDGTRRVSVPYADRVVQPVYVPGEVAIMEPIAGFYGLRISANSSRGLIGRNDLFGHSVGFLEVSMCI